MIIKCSIVKPYAGNILQFEYGHMQICLCNPEDDQGNRFNEKAVARYLEDKKDTSVRVKDIYAGCTSGKQPNCGKCLCMLKEIAQSHNNTANIEQLKSNLPEGETAPAAPAKRKPEPAGTP